MATESGSIGFGDFIPRDPAADWNVVSGLVISWPLSVLKTRPILGPVYATILLHFEFVCFRRHPSSGTPSGHLCLLCLTPGPPAKIFLLPPPKYCRTNHLYRQWNILPSQPPLDSPVFRLEPPNHRLTTIQETVVLTRGQLESRHGSLAINILPPLLTPYHRYVPHNPSPQKPLIREQRSRSHLRRRTKAFHLAGSRYHKGVTTSDANNEVSNR